MGQAADGLIGSLVAWQETPPTGAEAEALCDLVTHASNAASPAFAARRMRWEQLRALAVLAISGHARALDLARAHALGPDGDAIVPLLAAYDTDWMLANASEVSTVGLPLLLAAAAKLKRSHEALVRAGRAALLGGDAAVALHLAELDPDWAEAHIGKVGDAALLPLLVGLARAGRDVGEIGLTLTRSGRIDKTWLTSGARAWFPAAAFGRWERSVAARSRPRGTATEKARQKLRQAVLGVQPAPDAPDAVEHANLRLATLPSLDGLEEFVNLSHLSLVGTDEPRELSALAALPRLRSLSLRGTFADLPALLSRLSLEALSLDPPGELDFLAGLPTLRQLNLAGVVWYDLEPLPPLPSLQGLSVRCPPLRTTRGVERLPALTRLDLSYDRKLADLDGVETLTGLADLHLYETRIKRLPSNAGLVRLLVQHTGIKSLAGLERCGGLEHVSFCDTKVADVTPLVGLPRLTFVDLGGTAVPADATLAALRAEVTARGGKVLP